jgi:hypothetical protein
MRNYVAGEGFRVTTVPDVNLLYYSAAYTISEEQGEDWEASWPRRVADLSDKLRKRLEPKEDVSDAVRRLAVEELQARPTMYAMVLVKSAVKLFISHSLGSLYQLLGYEYTPSGMFSRIVFGILVAACCLTMLLFTLATASVGLERMRMPLMLPLALLSGLALQRRGFPPAVSSNQPSARHEEDPSHPSAMHSIAS